MESTQILLHYLSPSVQDFWVTSSCWSLMMGSSITDGVTIKKINYFFWCNILQTEDSSAMTCCVEDTSSITKEFQRSLQRL